MKKIISVFLILCTLLSVMIFPSFAEEEAATAITTFSELQGMVAGKHYYLANDIEIPNAHCKMKLQ